MQLQNKRTALKAAALSWVLGETQMVPPSFNAFELELLICVIGVVIFVGSFLAILVSAIFGVGLARLLYVGGRWCVGKVHHVHQVGGALPIVPHHSH
jgi:hypothetical protein